MLKLYIFYIKYCQCYLKRDLAITDIYELGHVDSLNVVFLMNITRENQLVCWNQWIYDGGGDDSDNKCIIDGRDRNRNYEMDTWTKDIAIVVMYSLRYVTLTSDMEVKK